MYLHYPDIGPRPATGQHPPPGYWFGVTDTVAGQRVLLPRRISWTEKDIRDPKTGRTSRWYVATSRPTDMARHQLQVIDGSIDPSAYNQHCLALVHDNPAAIAYLRQLLEGGATC